MFANIFSCRIVDVWNSLSDTVVKSFNFVASFINNLGAVDLSRFLTAVLTSVGPNAMRCLCVPVWHASDLDLRPFALLY